MKATAHEYHRQRRGNCAQSVAFAWASKNPGAENRVEAYAGCGAGRAPGGLCGALHASCELAGAGAAEEIRRGFAEKTGGHLLCRDIRSARALPCSECVAVAADLLEQHAARAGGKQGGAGGLTEPACSSAAVSAEGCSVCAGRAPE